MRRFVDLRIASLTSLSIAVLIGALAGCGDDTPGQSQNGGSGGAGGSGGSANDGGAGTGGAGGTDAGLDTGPEGGMDTMGEVPKPCYAVTFSAPTDGAMLTAANDKNGDNCVDGFQIDVQITTDAPDTTDVSLYGGNALLKTGTVTGGAVTFSDVSLATSGDTQLSIQFPGRDTCTAATTKARVNVDCHVPACSVTKPTISASHPKLNGVPAPAGDRVSQAGSPYQAAFEVTTDVADGQIVSLLVDNASTPTNVTTLTAMASGGKATFAGVTMTPDGTYEAQARCPAVNGVVGHSTKGTYIVDTTPPSLTVSQPTDGQFFGPGALTNGSFAVLASTTSADAANLGSGLGAAAQNLCAFIGSSPLCVAVPATGTSTRIDIPCTGGAPFDIKVVLNDDAGNTTSTTINAVACASSLPSVQIVTPLSDANTFNDPSKHLLAPSGGMTDVVACTNRAGTAVLSVGHMGDATLTQLGGAVITTAASAGCPAGFGFMATFANVKLPESLERADGTLLSPTELRVDLTDISTAIGSSLPLDVWVDSVAPVIGLTSPAGLCGSFHQTPGVSSFDTPVTLSSDTASLSLTVTNGSSTTTLAPTTFASNVATFANVSFAQGQSTLAAVATDPAGNSTTLATAPSPCTITVGMVPVVVFTKPTPANELCASSSAGATCIDDTTAGTPGWQGTLVAHVTGGGTPVAGSVVTFSVGTTVLGTATTDSNGDASLANTTLLDGTVTITATTDDVPGRGVGSGTVTVLVDTGPPDPVTNLVATVLDRRQTSFQLSWTAPADNGGRVTGYDVRVAKVQIDATNFDDTSVTTAVSFTGSPAAPGTTDGIAVKNLYIENGYFFAVRAFDAAGNKGAIAATSAAVTAHFNVSILNSPTGTNQLFGAVLDGSADVNGDGISDLLVGTLNDTHAYLFLGGSNFAPTTPSVSFTGVNTAFGNAVRFIGDVDGDGLPDLAISDQNGMRVLIYKGRSSWPSALADTDANYTVQADVTWAGSVFGIAMAPLGDFDGDGVDDFAIGGPGFNVRVGRAVVVYGSKSFASVNLPDATRSLQIGGDSTLTKSQFGAAIVGLGHFYQTSAGTTLVVSATGLASSSSNEGRIYAFHGRGPGAAIDVSAADNMTVGPGKPARIGQALVNLGPLVGPLASLGSGNPADTLSVPGVTGSAFIFSGTAAAGPLASKLIVFQSGASGVGRVLFGGGISGRDTTVSMIGDSHVDFALTSTTAATLDIIDGSKIGALTGPVSSTTVADVHVPLPGGWSATPAALGNLIPDVDGDGYPDFAVGDQFGSVPGRVAVFW
jgi:hypothetical protein